jgi:hypothetical protein
VSSPTELFGAYPREDRIKILVSAVCDQQLGRTAISLHDRENMESTSA